jgi:hypothetical protein
MRRIDWSAAKAAYVNDSTLTLRQIAERYGASETAVHNRSSREQWTQARTQKAQMLFSQATQRAIDVAADELSKWNEQDLLLAKALRAQVGKKLQAASKLQADEATATTTMESRDIRSLALAAESAQRIARLALGASTENALMGSSPIEGMPGIDVEVLSDDELVTLLQLLAKLRRHPLDKDTVQFAEMVRRANNNTVQ